jgi:hypothetical protein
VSAPGRESQLLGLAASRVLGAPVKRWEPGSEIGALVVAWTMESVPDDAVLRALSSHAPSSRLFVHASSWVEPFGYSPDVTTLLHQNITHPYTGGALRVDPKTQKVTPSEPDTRPDEVLVEEIVNAQISDASKTTLEHVLKVTKAYSGPVAATAIPTGWGSMVLDPTGPLLHVGAQTQITLEGSGVLSVSATGPGAALYALAPMATGG